jgi:hypothetical protein
MSLNYFDINDILFSLDDKKNIIFLDGYSINEKHKELLICINNWYRENRDNKRIIVISSMSSRGKSKDDEDFKNNIEEFFMYSWNLDEYKIAIQNDDFFDSIKSNLDSIINTKEISSKEELIESKFYYAGGSSRYMFTYPTKSVIGKLNQAIISCHDLMAYIENYVGEGSENVINRLFNIYEINSKKRKSIISEYVSTEIGIKFGPKVIQKLWKFIEKYKNPSMEGWMLEIWFFANLQNEGIKLYDINDNIVDIKKSDILNFDPDNLSYIKDILINSKKSIWLKPLKWNQGGYDVVNVDVNNNIVKFFQITRSSEHSFKLKYFYELMLNFSNYFETKTLEIYFIVPKDNILNFNIPNSKVDGHGLLQPFKWEKGKEVNNIKICGIEFDLSESF